jgi:hypothetical protein
MFRSIGIAGLTFVIGLTCGLFIKPQTTHTPSSVTAKDESAIYNQQPHHLHSDPFELGNDALLSEKKFRQVLQEEIEVALGKVLSSASVPAKQNVTQCAENDESDARQASNESNANTIEKPEITQAYNEAEEFVQLKLTDGAWYDDDRLQFHKSLSKLNAAQREKILSQLVKAMNDGTIQVMMDDSPF